MLTPFKKKVKKKPLLAALSTWQLLQTMATARSVFGFLLDAGADTNLVDKDGWTVLIYSCRSSSSLAIVRLLLDAGSKMNHQNSRGNSALYYASLYGHLDNVRLLLDFGADPNLANNGGYRPLMGATRKNYLEIVRLLIAGGAQVNSINNDGETALFYAESDEAVQLLFEHGADPRDKSNTGKTAFQHYRASAATATRHLFENWTPHQLLPPWDASAFPLYIDHCPGFSAAIKTTLVVLLRYRHIVPRYIGTRIISDIANCHRQEEMWPIEGFKMEAYMTRQL